MVGHHIGQLFLRVGLAATFLTAGLSKVLPKDQYEGEAAAALANMGVIKPQAAPAPGGGTEGGETPVLFIPTGFLLSAQPEAQPETPPATPPATTPATPPATEPATRPGSRPTAPPARATEPEEDVRSLTPRPGSQPEGDPEGAPEEGAATPAASGGPQYTAADFPTPVSLPRVYRIALMLKSAAHPAPKEDGTDRMALVPSWAADGKVPGLGMATPVVLAWLAAITEIVGGGMLLVGFMSRLWALGLVGVMVTAIWLTTIGPAMQAGDAFLGFLPSHHHIFAVTEHGYAYIHEFWQLALACMALAVMFAGPGAISVDGILFGGGDDEGGGED